MAKPNDYITATRKNFVSNDNEGRIVEKCIVEIQGTFLVKIRNDAFNGNDGENAYEHINKFLKIVGPIKINGLTQDGFRLSTFPVSLAGAAYEWFTKEYIGSITTSDNMVENQGSWGDATPGVIKFYRWLKSCFKNFHELEYEVLIKLQECRWKVNVHEIALFTHMENFGRGPYANIKTKWASNPYLDINRTFRRDCEANNIGCTQENQGLGRSNS
ncbi:hypothetical protein Tco_1189088 [Tanacetum coccineum]